MTTTASIKQALAQCAAYDCTDCPYRSAGCVISLIEDARSHNLLDNAGNNITTDDEEA